MFVLSLFGVLLSARTLLRELRRLGFRLIRPVLSIASPDPDYSVKLAQLNELKDQARRGEIVLLFEDEVDLHLLPGVTRCWTLRGQQYKVMTPGQNKKRYGFGTVDFVTGQIVFLASEHKESATFCELVKLVLKQYASESRPIVLVLDNYRIHSSKITLGGLAPFKDRLSAFFLPT